MERSWLRDNPLIAGLLGFFITGLGHVYLRRWLRAFAWVGLAFAVTTVFVPESTAEAVVDGSLTDPSMLEPMLPTLAVAVASALDAGLIAWRNSRQAAQVAMTMEEADGDVVACPACGKVVEADLGFCHWCTTEFEVVYEEHPRQE